MVVIYKAHRLTYRVTVSKQPKPSHSPATMAIKTTFLSLLELSGAVSVPQADYDVIIVGGGPAGLSALSGVARARRNALFFDNQQYQNGPAREMDDVIGNDGELYRVILE